MAAKQAEGYENEIIMITHGDCPEDAEYVAKRVQEKMGIQNIYINNIGTVIGGHTGCLLYTSTRSVRYGFTPLVMRAAVTAAPSGKLPSTVKSGKSSIL